jgi:protoporphyrinogen/coproporphyrinogen III oxidase
VSRARRPVVAVVGGGIAGMAAAWELVAGSGDDRPEVHVLEADDRVGGKLRSAEFGGRTVDLAADAFLARRPEAVALCEELGITDQLVPVGASGASILARGRLRPMPAGLALGIPTRWLALARSGILSPGELLRVGTDLVKPHLGTGEAFGDRAIGELVGERLGRPVVERLADPLIGGIHAGSVDDLSAAALFPVLIAASHQSGSFMRRLGRTQAAVPAPPTLADGSPSPVFWSLHGTTASLVDHLHDQLRGRGVTVRTGTRVEALIRVDDADGERWRLALGGGGALDADGVVVAVPAARAAPLLVAHVPRAAGLLSTVTSATVAVVTLAVPADAVARPLRGTGFLVPRTTVVEGRPALVTGCTYLGRKWPHLARPGEELLRVSVGRDGDDRPSDLGDDELVASAYGELADVLGITGPPLDSRVTRWPDAFPQYRPGHLLRVGAVERAVAEQPGLAVAGAAYRGVGIPACIGSGRAAARSVLGSLVGGPGQRTG